MILTPTRVLNLPVHVSSYPTYSGHEGFVWDVRGEEGVRAPFERLWKTKELLVSFDGATIAFPNWPDVPPLKPWPHVDQSPLKKGLQCLQGLVNLLPNYPDDGGLLVLKSSYKFNEEYFKHYGTVHNTSWRPEDWYGFTKEQLESFEKRGCEWEKVCAGRKSKSAEAGRMRIEADLPPPVHRTKKRETYSYGIPARFTRTAYQRVSATAWSYTHATVHAPQHQKSSWHRKRLSSSLAP